MKTDIIETHQVERTYFYNFEHLDEPIPDHENMVSYLLDESVIFLSDDEKGQSVLAININDYFCPGADAEDLPYKDIPKLFDMYKNDSFNGVAQYVADKRGIPNKNWREKQI